MLKVQIFIQAVITKSGKTYLNKQEIDDNNVKILLKKIISSAFTMKT